MSILFTLILLLPSALCLGSLCDLPCPQPWLTRSLTLMQDKPSLVDFLPQDAETLAAVRSSLSFFDSLGARLFDVDEELRIPRACITGRNDGSVIAARESSRHKGFGCIEPCLWSVHHASAAEGDRQSEAKRMFEAGKAFSDATVRAGARLNKEAGLGFEFVTSPQFLRGSSETSQCDMVKISAQRIEDGRWLLRSTIYDFENPAESEEVGKTIYVQMIYPDSNGRLRYFPYNVTFCATPGDRSTRFHRQANAVVTKWQSKPSWSDWATRNISDNPAIRRGMNDNDNDISASVFSEIDSAADIAIFLLPLVLALTPAVLFNSVRSVYSLAIYIVMDLLAAVPLSLKSIEFLTVSRAAKHFAEVFYYGSQNFSGSAAAELFVAECGFTTKYRTLGATMLATTCVLTALCVFLDILFYRMVAKKRKEHIKDLRARAVGSQNGSDASFSVSPEMLAQMISELQDADLMWYLSQARKRRTKISDESQDSEDLDDRTS